MNSYIKPKNMRAQVAILSSNYLRHGGKQERKKQVKRLCKALDLVGSKFKINDVRQIGKKQVKYFDRLLAEKGHSDKNRYNYWRAWKLLWGWLNRLNDPPKPKIGD